MGDQGLSLREDCPYQDSTPLSPWLYVPHHVTAVTNLFGQTENLLFGRQLKGPLSSD